MKISPLKNCLPQPAALLKVLYTSALALFSKFCLMIGLFWVWFSYGACSWRLFFWWMLLGFGTSFGRGDVSGILYASDLKLTIREQFALEWTFIGQTPTCAPIAIPPVIKYNKVFYCDWL